MTTITKERIELFIKNPLENGLTRGEQMETITNCTGITGTRTDSPTSMPNGLTPHLAALAPLVH